MQPPDPRNSFSAEQDDRSTASRRPFLWFLLAQTVAIVFAVKRPCLTPTRPKYCMPNGSQSTNQPTIVFLNSTQTFCACCAKRLNDRLSSPCCGLKDSMTGYLRYAWLSLDNRRKQDCDRSPQKHTFHSGVFKCLLKSVLVKSSPRTMLIHLATIANNYCRSVYIIV